MARKEPGSCDCNQQIGSDHRHLKIGADLHYMAGNYALSRLNNVSAAGHELLLKLVLRASSHQTNATC
jgi:hypothetical protein